MTPVDVLGILDSDKPMHAHVGVGIHGAVFKDNISAKYVNFIGLNLHYIDIFARFLDLCWIHRSTLNKNE